MKYYFAPGHPQSEGKLVYGCRDGKWRFYSYSDSSLVSTEHYKHGVIDGPYVYYDTLTKAKLTEGFFSKGVRSGKWSFFTRKGKVHTVENYKLGVLEGEAIYYDTIGGLKTSHGYHLNNVRTGEWRFYGDDGTLIATENYKEGLLQGEIMFFGPDGKLSEKGNYNKGKREGEWRTYAQSGKVAYIGTYKEDKQIGYHAAYDTLSGFILSEGNIMNDNKHGEWKLYFNDDRRMVSFIDSYDNGVLKGMMYMYDSVTGLMISSAPPPKDTILEGKVFKYYANGQVSKEFNVKGEQLTGVSLFFDSLTGKVVVKQHYDKGKLDGDQFFYDTSGKLTGRLHYVNGVQSGPGEIFYPNGSRWIELNYINDTLNGALNTYYASGKVKRREVYKSGKRTDGECFNELGKQIKFYPFESTPKFKGDVMTYIGDNLKYPQAAKDAKAEGKVLVRFIVDESGKVINPEIIERVGYGCDEEALRIVSHMPTWIPAQIDGVPFKMYKTLPIVFWLPED